MAVFAGALITLAIFSGYQMNLLKEKENALNNMRARALWTLGSEMAGVAHFLHECVDTLDYELITKEVRWAVARMVRETYICKQGLSEDSGLMYYELSRMAWHLEHYFLYTEEPFNITNVETIANLLPKIAEAFGDFDMLRNKNPIEYLEELSRAGITPSVDEVIDYCKQIQEID